MIRTRTAQSGGMNRFPSFSQDEWGKSKSGYRSGPRFTPDGVDAQAREGNQSHVTTKGGFGGIGLQGGARSNDCQLPFPTGEPRRQPLRLRFQADEALPRHNQENSVPKPTLQMLPKLEAEPLRCEQLGLRCGNDLAMRGVGISATKGTNAQKVGGRSRTLREPHLLFPLDPAKSISKLNAKSRSETQGILSSQSRNTSRAIG